MPAHDLTHFAVESTLGVRRGFYGLLTEGWEITDFAKPWPRGPIPDEALVVELIVGVLDAERRQGEAMTAAAFQMQAEQYVASRVAVGVDTDVPEGMDVRREFSGWPVDLSVSVTVCALAKPFTAPLFRTMLGVAPLLKVVVAE